jgi:uncharacterized membrane protein SirB2
MPADALLIMVTLTVAVVAIRILLDLGAHVSRYRRYTRSYPATRSMRGRVWRSTR